MATAERENTMTTRTAAEEGRRSLKTKTKALKVLEPAPFSSPLQMAYNGDDHDRAPPPAQCASSNLGTAEGVRQCQDACEPGLCCLAEQGQQIEFSFSTGSSKLTGCRTDANAAWCGQFEGCLSILALAKHHDSDSKPDAPVVPAADPKSSAGSNEIETQCHSPVVETDEGAERCSDACTPGLCCLADEGTSAAFSVPGKAGEVVTLAGCRSPSNEAQCLQYLPCGGAFEPAAADLKAGAAAAVTGLHRTDPRRQAYMAGGFVALAVLATLAAVRLRTGGEGGRVRRRSVREILEDGLLDDASDSEDDERAGPPSAKFFGS